MNNIYKKLSVILMFLSMVGCFSVSISCVNAVSGSVTGGYAIPTPVGSSYCPSNVTCGSDGSGGRQPVAYGYRISVVDSRGNVVSGTNSMDYWSDWGSYGYSYLSNKDSVDRIFRNSGKSAFFYYKNQGPKTVGSSNANKDKNYSFNTKNKKETLVSERYADNVKTEFHTKAKFTCNGTELYGFNSEKLTSGGCSVGGDTRIGNNFSKYALFVMNEIMRREDKSEAISVFGSILNDCGVSGDDNNSRIMNVNDKYLIVEPLTAIYDWNGSYIYVGTVYDLYKLGYSAFSVPYVYNNFMYINPVVYNTEERAGLRGCNSNPNNTVASLSNGGCAGAFTISIGDVSPSCEAQAKTALKAYQSGGTTAAYNRAIDNACNTLTDGDKNTCKNVLKNYANYGIINSDDITSCNFTCNGVAQKISDNKRGTTNVISEIYDDLFSKLKNTIYSGILGDTSDKNKYKDGEVYNIFVYRENLSTDRTKLCETTSCDALLLNIKTDRNKVKKLANLFPNFPLLKEEVYEALETEPKCGTLPPNCYASSDGNCSNGNLVFKDSENEKCIRGGVAYYDDNQSNLQPSKNSRYSTIAGPEIFCSEKVTFNLPTEDSSIVKAGRVFQWGTNIETSTNNGSADDVKTFGTMTIKQTCYTSDVKNKISEGKIFNFENNNNINTKISIKYTDPTGKYVTDENKYLSPILDSIQYDENYMNSEGKIIRKTDNFTISATYKFDYNLEFKWYSDKSDNYESKNKLTLDDVNDSLNYVFIGYGLPTSFATSDGLYEENLDVIIKNIGTNDRFDKYVEKILGQSNGYNYSCSFKIHNESFGNECCTKEGEIIPNAPAYCGSCEGNGDPKGLDVVFRTIDLMDSNTKEELDRAFPGMSGTGLTGGNRKMGANWDKVYSAEDGAKQVFNILSSSIYDDENREPMYRITLDVSLIKKIREANAKIRADGDPYTDMTYESGAAFGGTGLRASKENGYRGYLFDRETNSAMSAFLNWLVREGALKTSCMDGRNHIIGCHQEWWNEE